MDLTLQWTGSDQHMPAQKLAIGPLLLYLRELALPSPLLIVFCNQLRRALLLAVQDLFAQVALL